MVKKKSKKLVELVEPWNFMENTDNNVDTILEIIGTYFKLLRDCKNDF